MLQVVDAGVFILRSFLSPKEQLNCYEECRKLYKKDEVMYKNKGSIANILKTVQNEHRGRFLLAFEPNKNEIDEYFDKLGQSVMNRLYAQILQHKQCKLILQTLPRKLPIHSHDQTSDVCDDQKEKSKNEENKHETEWISDRLNCVLYPFGSMLGRHVDNMNGWVILFSFGCDAKFFLHSLCNKHRKNGTVISMHSGDVIIFEGGDKQRVLHGVDSIVPHSAPKYFENLLKNARIGLQLRQYIGIETHKVPSSKS